MIEIIKNLFLGNMQDAIRVSKTQEVDAIVYVGQELPDELAFHTLIPVVHIPLVDGVNDELRIHLALMNIGYLTLEDKTLVACRAGLSRSPTLVVGFLSAYLSYDYKPEDEKAYTFDEAYKYVYKLVPKFQPEQNLLKTIKKVAKSYREKKPNVK